MRAGRGRSLIAIIALVAAALPLSAVAFSSPAAAAAPIKILPLGDSITTGAHDGHSSPGGYRVLLEDLLVGGGYSFDFVGTQTSGPSGLNDKNHEGHNGFLINDIRANIFTYLATAPDVVLLMIGANDIGYGWSRTGPSNYPDPVSEAPARLAALIDTILQSNSSRRVIVAKVTPWKIVTRDQQGGSCTTGETCITDYFQPWNDATVTYNNAIPGIVATRAARVSMVDMNANFPRTGTWLDDEQHPNRAGYNEIAGRWYNQNLKSVLDSLTPPPTSSTTTTTSTPTSTTAPPAGTKYLSDLTPLVAANGLGPVERDKANGGSGNGDGGPITLDGATYAKGLGVNAYSEVEYNIAGYQTFRAEIGLDDTACTNTVRIEVALNGSVINVPGAPASFTTATAKVPITVNIAGKSKLKLSVIRVGSGTSPCDHFDWADARVIGAGTPPSSTTSTTVPPSSTTSSTTTTSTTTTTSSTTTTTAPTTTTSAPTTTTAPPAGASFLSDRTPLVKVNGLGPVEKDRANGGAATGDGGPLLLNGITHPKGLGVNAYSEVEYDITGYKTFMADVGLDDTACAAEKVRVEIALNGSVIGVPFLPSEFNANTPTFALNVNLTGKTKLKLSVIRLPNGSSSACDHFDWANARVLP